MRKAGDLIQRFSESTHIDVLNKACKMMKVRKKLNSFSSTVQVEVVRSSFIRRVNAGEDYDHHYRRKSR